MTDNKLKCDLCGELESTIVFEGPIRSGVFGKQTNDHHRVVECVSCGLVRLEENPLVSGYYESSEYRSDYNDTNDVDEYIDEHDKEQPPRLSRIGIDSFRDKVVLDYGCGGGAFLDLVQGVAKETVGIEPYSGYHNSLRERGHDVFSSSADAIREVEGRVDTIVSFGVIEHVESPSLYLKDAYSLLSDRGVMHIETDNLNDILLKLRIPAFESFFYRTAHLWYFDHDTLEKISTKTGFTSVAISHRHNFDLSNSLMWALKDKPTGLGKLQMFDQALESAWVSFIEGNGYADLVCAEIRKK